MTTPHVPQIFAERRRQARLARAAARQRQREGAACFLIEEIGADMIERLSFLRFTPIRALVIGPCPAPLAAHLARGGTSPLIAERADPALPLEGGQFDFIGVIGQLDAVNDLPGALIQINRALAPGGLAIASFLGGQSLAALRAAMLAAEPDRPAARLHPMVDARAAPALLQRAGWKDPVVDSHVLAARYASLERLVADLRDQGLSNALARPAPPLGRAALARARAAFGARAEADGKVRETFEIITLTGRRSRAGT